MSLFRIFASAKKPSPPIVAPPSSESAYQAARTTLDRTASEPSPLADEERPRVTVVPPKPRVETMFVPPGFAGRLYSLATKPLLSDEQKKLIQQKQLEYERVQNFELKHLPDHADQAWLKQQQEHAALVVQGRGDEVSERDSWNREEWRDCYYQKRKALSNQAKEITWSVLPIAFEVAEELGSIAAKELAKVESADAELCKSWGIDYRPSRLAQILRYVAAHPRELVPAYAVAPPRSILSFVGITID